MTSDIPAAANGATDLDSDLARIAGFHAQFAAYAQAARSGADAKPSPEAAKEEGRDWRRHHEELSKLKSDLTGAGLYPAFGDEYFGYCVHTTLSLLKSLGTDEGRAYAKQLRDGWIREYGPAGEGGGRLSGSKECQKLLSLVFTIENDSPDAIARRWEEGELEPFVSVVIPSLNVAEYMDECLKSVVKQSVSNIEIICIDAQSDDGTLEIIERYANRDARIRVISSDKRSFGYQMNLGIENSRGAFLGIVEADDYIGKKMYESYLKTACLYGDLDFVKSDFQRFDDKEEGRVFVERPLTKALAYYNRELAPKDDPALLRLNNLCQPGIYRLSFIRGNGIRYNESPGASYQDNGFWFQVFASASAAVFLQESHYFKRHDNPNSSVRAVEKAFEMCDEYDFIRSWLDSSEELAPFIPWCAAMRYTNYLSRLNAIADWVKPAFFERWARDFKELDAAGELDIRLFAPAQWSQLQAIMRMGSDYYYLVHKPTQASLSTARRHKNRAQKLKQAAEKYNSGPLGLAKRAAGRLKRISQGQGASKANAGDSSAPAQFKGLSTTITSTKLYSKCASMADEGYPDMLRWIFKDKGCGDLDLDNPRTVNEKIQWYKLNVLRSPLYTKLVDKIAVRDWVEERIGSQYLTRIHASAKRFEDIDLGSLPSSFVLKTNHGSAMVYLVPDKDRLDVAEAKETFDAWLKTNFAYCNGLELQYENVPPRIYVEEYLEGGERGMADYKFWCFDGKVAYIQYIDGRGDDPRISYFDKDWNIEPFNDNKPFHSTIPARPSALDEMVGIAEKLADGFQFVRVDLYEVNGQIKFSELTFTPASGFCKWNPPEFNYILGDLWTLKPGENSETP